MFDKKCECLLPALISIILGIIVGFIAFSFTIPEIVITAWIAFGIGMGALLLIYFTALQAQGREEWCVCKYGECIVIGAILTIIIAIIALAIAITAGVLFIAVLIGLGTFALSFTIFSVTKFILCLVKTNCKCRD